MSVGIDAFPQDMTVPEVAIDVVGEFGGEGKEGNTGDDADSPQEQQGRGGTPVDANPGRHVAEKPGCGQEQARQGQRNSVQPPESGERGHFDEAEQQDGDDRRERRLPRISRWPVVTGDVRDGSGLGVVDGLAGGDGGRRPPICAVRYGNGRLC